MENEKSVDESWKESALSEKEILNSQEKEEVKLGFKGSRFHLAVQKTNREIRV